MNPIDELIKTIKSISGSDKRLWASEAESVIRAAMPGILIDFAKYSRNTRNLIYPSDTVVAAYLSQNEQGEK